MNVVKVVLVLLASVFLFSINSCFYACDKRFGTASIIDTAAVRRIIAGDSVPVSKMGVPVEKLVENGIHLRSHEAYEGMLTWNRYEDNQRINDNNYSSISINCMVFKYAEGATDLLNSDLNQFRKAYFKENVFVAGDSTKRFVFTKTMEAQADPEGLCSPMGYFYNNLEIQNKNLLIQIVEQTSNKKSRRINTVSNKLINQ